MNERKLSNFCLLLLAFSMLLRLICATGADARMAESVPAAQTEPDEPAAPAAQQLRVWPVRVIRDGNASEAEPWEQLPGTADRQTDDAERAPALTFSPEEADAITIAGACTYSVDKQALLTRPSALDFSGEGPKVLIVHTHSSEAYTMEVGFEYQESDALRTLDERYSVIRVGDEIADILTEAGISVLHDTQPNDYPNYNGAYERMRQTIEGYLAEYPSIQMVLDIHRDAAEDADGSPVALTAEADGEACAELMLVVGTDEGGLSHPDWQENLANALKIQTLLNRSAPGLCRNLNLRTERFNQHETPGSLLVEVGASGNTLAEALRSARILGQALAVFLRGQMHDDTD